MQDYEVDKVEAMALKSIKLFDKDGDGQISYKEYEMFVFLTFSFRHFGFWDFSTRFLAAN